MNPDTLLGKVYLFLVTPHGYAEDCIKWAVRMLCKGYDSEHLRELAGIEPPFNDFEIIEYVKRSLSELGLPVPNEDMAIKFYAMSLADEILHEPSRMDGNLEILFRLCHQNDSRADLMNFYLLHCAKGDLQISDIQYYWDGADLSNIDDIILNECRKYAEQGVQTDVSGPISGSLGDRHIIL